MSLDYSGVEWVHEAMEAARMEGYEQGYRDGYNDHARSRAYGEQVYGLYTQHGTGENP